jgi:hypothetical protein
VSGRTGKSSAVYGVCHLGWEWLRQCSRASARQLSCYADVRPRLAMSGRCVEAGGSSRRSAISRQGANKGSSHLPHPSIIWIQSAARHGSPDAHIGPIIKTVVAAGMLGALGALLTGCRFYFLIR